MLKRSTAGAGALGFEALAAYWLFVAGSPAMAFAAHVAGCFLLAVWGAEFIDRARELPGVRVWLFGVMLPVPVAGPICAALLLAAMLLISEKSQREGVVVVGLPGAMSAAAHASPGARAKSIIEVLASPDTLARREAVLSLRSDISPAAVLILQKAVGDSDEQVRNYAQSQLAKWTEQAELQIKRLAALPDAPEVQMAHAECLRGMVAAHLAGPELEGKYLRIALGCLEKIPSGSPLRANADLLSVSCHLRLRQPAPARAALVRLESAGYRHESLAGLRLRIFFHERDWAGLLGDVRRATPGEAPPDVLHSTKFWDRATA